MFHWPGAVSALHKLLERTAVALLLNGMREGLTCAPPSRRTWGGRACVPPVTKLSGRGCQGGAATAPPVVKLPGRGTSRSSCSKPTMEGGTTVSLIKLSECRSEHIFS
ncbi:hypothetical protein M513_14271 [Trichuris suis]|uniref:Secreted protein n=1 Tax=Trichuris suis TaxID=68888 RepID=A0A085LIQ6_9BILA|nr:hypothetical protein M513_14271 [Trichuris suis]